MVSRMSCSRVAVCGSCISGGVGIYVFCLSASAILMRVPAGSVHGVGGIRLRIFLRVWWLLPSSSYLVWQMRRYSPLVHCRHFSASVRSSGFSSVCVTFVGAAWRIPLLR